MYQARRIPFCNKENYNDKRASRAEEKVKNRRLSRQKNFTSNRDIAVDLVQTVAHQTKEPEKLSRYEQLLQWKQEKERFKKTEQNKKAKEKPPFKCGLVHHKPPPILEADCRRSTRIKNMKNPVEGVKIPNAKSLNITGRTKNNKPTSCSKPFQSFAPTSHQFKAPSNLPKIAENSMSVSQLVDPKVPDTRFSMCFPAQLSPWISKARGSDGGKVSPSCKGNNKSPLSNQKIQTPMKICEMSKGTPDDLRKLVGKRLLQKALKTPEELETEEKQILFRAATPVLTEEDADNIQNFKSLYEAEMDRLDKLCSQWDSLLSSGDCLEIPEEVQDSICATVGQTRLLMRKKLAQFNDLLQKSKQNTSKSFQVITCSDLQGFWDLVSIQVNDVDAKFRALDVLKWNSWVGVEDQKQILDKAIVHRRGVNKNSSKKKHSIAAKSSFKAYIAEQRKKNEEAKGNGTIVCCEAVNSDTTKEEKTTGIVTSPQVTISSAHTPTTILKRRSSRRCSFKRGFNEQAGSITPKRSSRRVTFADTTPGDCTDKPKVRNTPTPHVRCFKGTSVMDEKPNALLMKSPNFAVTEGDLISWESPTKDYLHVGQRKSPRFSTDTHNSFL